jgi:hypothetical protein
MTNFASLLDASEVSLFYDATMLDKFPADIFYPIVRKVRSWRSEAAVAERLVGST